MVESFDGRKESKSAFFLIRNNSHFNPKTGIQSQLIFGTRFTEAWELNIVVLCPSQEHKIDPYIITAQSSALRFLEERL